MSATDPDTLQVPVTLAPRRSWWRRRRWALASVVLVAVAVVAVLVAKPFLSPGAPSSGVSGNGAPISTTTVSERALLTSQTELSATLGYTGSSNILLPGGTAPSALTQDKQKVEADQSALNAAQASLTNTQTSNEQGLTSAQQAFAADQTTLQADEATLSQDEATLSSAQQKEEADCQGQAAASSSQCASDAQTVSADQAKVNSDHAAVSSDQSKVSSDRAQVNATQIKDQGTLEQAQAQVTTAQQALSADQATLALDQTYASSDGQTSTYTALPAVGQVITEGHSLFAVNGNVVPLLYGDVTPYRSFASGMSPGTDVAELDQALATLGDGSGLAGKDTFTAATAAAIGRLQGSLGLPETDQLQLGSVIFDPGAVRVTSVTPQVGSAVTAGPVLGVTLTARVVTIALDADQASEVAVGDQVSITLPNNQTTPGVISSVGTVATTPSGGGSPTITVLVNPTDPAATGNWDQAPVDVTITTGSVSNALVVPVDALLALTTGGYALEVVSARGVHSLEPVSLGLFDDADGLVQVSGRGVVAGQRIVQPSL